jgi:quinol monooxygenase YgiN
MWCGMIQSTLKMEFAPNKASEALMILQSIIERVRAEPGCMGCTVYQDAGDKHLIVYEEEWRDDACLQQHLRSDGYREVLLVMEMARRHPEVRFDTISASRGVETIEEARIGKKE